jgi:hypothetical protein
MSGIQGQQSKERKYLLTFSSNGERGQNLVTKLEANYAVINTTPHLLHHLLCIHCTP